MLVFQQDIGQAFKHSNTWAKVRNIHRLTGGIESNKDSNSKPTKNRADDQYTSSGGGGSDSGGRFEPDVMRSQTSSQELMQGARAPEGDATRLVRRRWTQPELEAGEKVNQARRPPPKWRMTI